MTSACTRLVAIAFLLASVNMASAQTADEVVEKSLAAMGGRQALEKVKSRRMSGTLVVSTPGGDINGSVDILNATPNKARFLMKADLSALGAGELVIDQRFDGTNGYVLDSLQGNRDITGNQLENMKNSSFPHPFLTLKEQGTAVQLNGKEKVGDGEAYLLILTPKSGSVIRAYVDADTYLPARMIVKAEVPQLGGEVEQTTEFLDYRELDGIKVPSRLRISSSVQNVTITLKEIEHNVEVDPKLFSKPAGQ
jgi:outer membrane lipoprotein-sorting protein